MTSRRRWSLPKAVTALHTDTGLTKQYGFHRSLLQLMRQTLFYFTLFACRLCCNCWREKYIFFCCQKKMHEKKPSQERRPSLRRTALHRRAEASARLSHSVALLPQCTIAALDCVLKQQLLPANLQSSPYDDSNFKPAKCLKFEERGNGTVELCRYFGTGR